MPRIRWLGLALLACVAVFSPAVGFAEPVGSALVVGIDDYAGMPVLANCRQVAKDVAARLRQRGLQVDEEIDVPGAAA